MGLPIPREHGAWAMLLTSLALGQAVAARLNPASLYLWLLVIAVFCLREPLHLGGKRPETARWWAAVLAAVALVSAGALFRRYGPPLLYLAVPAAVLFALHARWQRRGARRSWPAELAGTAGITLAAPAAYYAATGSLGMVGISLWMVLFAYFATQVAFVRWKLRAPTNRRLGLLTLLLQALVAAALLGLGFAGIVPPGLFLAFIPGMIKAYLAAVAKVGRRQKVARIGWTEVLYSLMFFALALGAYHWP